MKVSKISSLFFVAMTLLLLFFVSCSGGSNVFDDLASDTSAVYTFYAWNPADYPNSSSVKLSYPIGKSLSAENLPDISDERIFALRPGYEFAGWTYYKPSESYTSKSVIKINDVTNLVDSIQVSADYESFYVKDWSPVKYYLVLNGNKGSLTDGKTQLDKIEFTYDESQSLPANSFIYKNGSTDYSFVGWGLSESQDPHEPSYIDGALVCNLTPRKNETVNFYALWLKSAINISYDGNSGSGSMANQEIKIAELPSTLNSQAFSKDGYNFICWNTRSDGSGKSYYDGETIYQANYPEDDVTLYAIWKITNYYVCYHLDSSTVYEGQSVEWDQQAVKPQDPVKVGYDFKGWYSSTDGGTTLSSTEFDFSTHIKENVDLYAKWEMQTTTVKYNLNGASITPHADEVIPYSQIEANGEWQPAWIDDMIRAGEGLRFSGWSLSASSVEDIDNFYRLDPLLWDSARKNASGDVTITIYAKWEELFYYANFTLDGGTLGDMSAGYDSFGIKVLSGSRVSNPGSPQKTGYVFNGWYNTDVNGNLTDLYDFTLPVTEDRHLKASWGLATYTVTFEGNGATGGSMSAQTFTYGEVKSLTPINFTKVGYTFYGWALVASAMSPVYSNAQSISISSDIKLYAHWAARASVSSLNKLDCTVDGDNEQLIFTASEEYSSYIWSIDGTTISGGSSITVPYSTYANGNNHFVLLIGVNSSGESTAESANFKILP